jgi:hypothetical protein
MFKYNFLLKIFMIAKKVIKLPSSKKVFGHDDGTCEKATLIALLGEGFKRKLNPTDKIFITEEYLPDDFLGDSPTLANLKNRQSTITYGELNKLYENRYGKKYSPEAEKERRELDLGLEIEMRHRKNSYF